MIDFIFFKLFPGPSGISIASICIIAGVAVLTGLIFKVAKNYFNTKSKSLNTGVSDVISYVFNIQIKILINDKTHIALIIPVATSDATTKRLNLSCSQIQVFGYISIFN